MRSLAAWLDEQEILTSAEKAWRTTTLRQMLRSGRIAGLREHRGEVVGPAVWDAIITEDQHRRIRAKMDQRAATGERSPRSYLLSGLAVCSKCGGRLFAQRRVDRRRYVCSSGPDHRGCGGIMVTAAPLEELVTEAVLFRLDTAELADELTGRANQSAEAVALTDPITQDTEQLDELAGLYASKAITAKEWMTARNPIEARRADTQRRLDRLDRTDTLTELAGTGQQLRAEWSQLNLGRQVAIVRSLVDHITIHPATQRGRQRLDPNRVDITWRI